MYKVSSSLEMNPPKVFDLDGFGYWYTSKYWYAIELFYAQSESETYNFYRVAVMLQQDSPQGMS